jgi:hypothetical protein
MRINAYVHIFAKQKTRSRKRDERKRRGRVRLGVQRMVWLAGQHSIMFVAQRKVTPPVSCIMHSYTLNWALREIEREKTRTFI